MKKKRVKVRKKGKPPFRVYAPPKSLKGKEFEELCLLDAHWQRERRNYLMGRYGVQVSFRKDENGNTIPMPVKSLPDFEGVTLGGRQFIIEAKTCSSSSFSLHESIFKERQLSHMLKRADFGVLCFLLVHFSERTLKKGTDLAVTYAMPVRSNHVFWEQVAREEVKSLSRTNCREYANEVRWWIPKGCKKPRPDLGGLLLEESVNR